MSGICLEEIIDIDVDVATRVESGAKRQHQHYGTNLISPQRLHYTNILIRILCVLNCFSSSSPSPSIINIDISIQNGNTE